MIIFKAGKVYARTSGMTLLESGKYRRGQGTGVGQFSYAGHVGDVGQGWTLHFAPSFYSAQVILLTLTFY